MPRRITEARRSLPVEAGQVAGAAGRLHVQLIDAGWGSSGYYPAEVLQRDGAAFLPAGTHMYLDHAGLLEEHDRSGIRSVRDLAAVTTTDATYNETTQALEADVQVLAPYRGQVAELAPFVGLSITGSAVGEQGEAAGRNGIVFTELVQGYSCDFVAHAGRGGRVLEVLESAGRRIREGYGLTASDQRDMLGTAVDEAFGGQGVWCWVRDYTDEWIVFERDQSDSNGLFQVTYTVADNDVTFTGDLIEVTAHTQYLPVGTRPPAQSVTPTQEASTMPEIPEAELRSLRETADRVTAAEQAQQAAEQRAAEAERRESLLTAAGVARGRVDTALTEASAAQLPAASRERVVERALRDLPLADDGALDTAAFDTRVAEAVTAERTFAATLAEQMGLGRPSGLGGAPAPNGGTGEALATAQTKLTEAFKGLGMSDDAAALAAKGR